jgi:hypothetical protein
VVVTTFLRMSDMAKFLFNMRGHWVSPFRPNLGLYPGYLEAAQVLVIVDDPIRGYPVGTYACSSFVVHL